MFSNLNSLHSALTMIQNDMFSFEIDLVIPFDKSSLGLGFGSFPYSVSFFFSSFF